MSKYRLSPKQDDIRRIPGHSSNFSRWMLAEIGVPAWTYLPRWLFIQLTARRVPSVRPSKTLPEGGSSVKVICSNREDHLRVN